MLLVSIGCGKNLVIEPDVRDFPVHRFLCADTVHLGELQAFHFCPGAVADLICQDPEEARDLLMAFGEIEGDLGVCGAELEGCRMEIEIRKKGKLRKYGWLLAAFAGGYIVADLAD